ncbi:MAG: hypothetical protein NVS1B11_21640 [Terriglobales bacterium]
MGGWEYSGVTTFNTGSPFTVLYTAGIANGIGATVYADVVGNPRASVVQTPLDGFGPIYYNPAAFAAPRGLTFGKTLDVTAYATRIELTSIWLYSSTSHSPKEWGLNFVRKRSMFLITLSGCPSQVIPGPQPAPWAPQRTI